MVLPGKRDLILVNHIVFGAFEEETSMSHHHHHSPRQTFAHFHATLPHHQLQGSAKGPLVHVIGKVVAVYEDRHSNDGWHQHFDVTITETVTIEGSNETLGGETVFVASRYGDNDSKHDRIEGIEVGKEVELKGEYIDSKRAHPTEDNNQPPIKPVIHFVHSPVGFVKIDGKTYQ